MWHFFAKGGFIMYPLLACSIVGLVIVIERVLFFSRNTKDEPEFERLKQLLIHGKLSEAKILTTRWDSPISHIAANVIGQWELSSKFLENAVQSAGELELSHLQRGLSLLDTIVTASPLLGLLGTVTGIIKSFVALSFTGGAQSAQLSAGIAEALYNTAFGLGIAIPALFFVSVFYGIAERRARDLNGKCQEIITIHEDSRARVAGES